MKHDLLIAATVILGIVVADRIAAGHGGEVPPPVPPPPGVSTGTGGTVGGGSNPATGGGKPITPGGGKTKPPGDTPDAPRPKSPNVGLKPQPPGGLNPPAPTPPSNVNGPATPVPSGAGKKGRASTSLDRWDIWWNFNKDPYLQLRSRLRPTVPRSGPTAFLTGMGRRVEGIAWSDPTPEDIAEVIAPALREALEADEAEVVDSAIIALGRIMGDDAAAQVVTDVAPALASRYPTVRQSAILTLGIVGHRNSMPILWELMSDTATGRAWVGSAGPVQSIDRAFAALSLGFVCGPEMVPHLRRLVSRMDGADIEVVAGAVLSLGLIEAAATDIVPFLAELLDDERLDRRVRAQVPISLARLGTAAVPALPSLFALATDRRADQQVRRSCVIALGRLATTADAEVVSGLRKVIRNDSDAQLRHFALIALGQIGAAALSEDRRDRAGADEITQYLSSEMADPGHGVDLPWAVLAAGVAGHAYAQGADALDRLGREIVALMKRTGNPSDLGAMAIALGLLGTTEAGPLLLDRLYDSNDAALRGHLAVALGLIGYREATPALRKILFEHNNPGLRVNVATALGLMGDADATDRLVGMLASAPTFAVTGSIAQALGQIADRSAIEPLAALVRDGSQPSAVRGFSCVALGLIAEKTPLPWNAPLSINSNYTTGLVAQAVVLDIY